MLLFFTKISACPPSSDFLTAVHVLLKTAPPLIWCCRARTCPVSCRYMPCRSPVFPDACLGLLWLTGLRESQHIQVIWQGAGDDGWGLGIEVWRRRGKGGGVGLGTNPRLPPRTLRGGLIINTGHSRLFYHDC